MSGLPKVAFIGTGGTMSSIGADTLDLVDYAANDKRLEADEIVATVLPELSRFAQILPVRFRAIPSFDVSYDDWRDLVALCSRLVEEHPDLAGIVIGHGTSSLEETAYFLNLTLRVQVPVVITGSQRPLNVLSSDAGLNLVNAVRVAADRWARGLGVLVVLNDEIHAAREVAKSSTLRLQTFTSPDFGVLGHVDRDRLQFYRRPIRQAYPATPFVISDLPELPRVDIIYAHLGSDGTALRAVLAAGARGIVSAGFAPGHPGRVENELLKDAAAKGVLVVQSRRGHSGRIPVNSRLDSVGAISGDNLAPEKARLLLQLALTRTNSRKRVSAYFERF